MATDSKRFVLKLEAKIIKSPVNRSRYVVARFPRETGGFSYHYFAFGDDDNLINEKTRPAIRRLLNLPNASDTQLNPFYDELWDGTVNMVKVKELRAKTAS
jgi:hypothetical protein